MSPAQEIAANMKRLLREMEAERIAHFKANPLPPMEDYWPEDRDQRGYDYKFQQGR